MKITWLGHACFKIEGQDITLITDPFDRSVGYPINPTRSDYITVSHEHFDHSDTSWIGGAQIIDTLGEHRYPGLHVVGLPSYHDALRGKIRGQNRIYKINMDGITLCHLGDLGESLHENLWRSIGRIDVLMVPVGGNYTIDATEAKKMVNKLEPYLTIAMHYSTPACPIQLETEDNFLQLTNGTKLNEPFISFSREDLVKGRQVIALDWLKE